MVGKDTVKGITSVSVTKIGLCAVVRGHQDLDVLVGFYGLVLVVKAMLV